MRFGWLYYIHFLLVIMTRVCISSIHLEKWWETPAVLRSHFVTAKHNLTQEPAWPRVYLHRCPQDIFSVSPLVRKKLWLRQCLPVHGNFREFTSWLRKEVFGKIHRSSLKGSVQRTNKNGSVLNKRGSSGMTSQRTSLYCFHLAPALLKSIG